MWIGHRKEIRKLTFRALALRIRSDEGLTLETSAFESFYGGQFTLSTQLIKPNYLKLTFVALYPSEELLDITSFVLSIVSFGTT